MSQKFQRTKEDFTCAKCGAFVSGNGFTNHCPHCLYSMHVDEFPGDRSSLCKGLMEPITLVLRKGEYAITHRCVVCGFERTTKAAPEDHVELLLKEGKNSQ